jgi:hypothetical protein
MLAIDHEMLMQGQAFTNYSGLLYPAISFVNGLNMYSTPYRQLVNDITINGANIMSGVYVNGSYIQPGTSGLNSINITEGQCFFTGTPSTVSGIYAVKDYNLYITSEPEERMLFETKMFIRPRMPQILTGLPQDAQTCPAIFMKTMGGNDIPFCLGGGKNKSYSVRALIFGDSEFSMNAACDILRTMTNKYYQIIDPLALPFNAWGGFTGVNYDYSGLITEHSIGQTYINKIDISSLMSARQFSQVNPKIFPAFADFELWNFLM